MKTSHYTAGLPVLVLILALVSCQQAEEILPGEFLERTDISLSGDLAMESFQQQGNETTGDLIRLGYYGEPSEQFDFHIALSDGYSLTIVLYDAQRLNPWQQVGIPYNIYPGEDLEDKLAYADIMLYNKEGICTHSTNKDPISPPGALLDVFRITANTGESIQARIRDMVLYRHGDPGRTVRINGTFAGSVDF